MKSSSTAPRMGDAQFHCSAENSRPGGPLYFDDLGKQRGRPSRSYLVICSSKELARNVMQGAGFRREGARRT
eukprot:3171239-Lingulodinium_polyedra.AAC.1